MGANDLLTTFAELGVALAGFSGIVVVLGTRARGEWSSRERLLLSILLNTSGAAVLWSVLPLLLLATQVPERSVWLLSSGSWFVVTIAGLALRGRQAAREPHARAQERVLLISGFGGELVALGVQLTNLLWLGVAWPHLFAVAWHLVLAFHVFVRLLQPTEV